MTTHEEQRGFGEFKCSRMLLQQLPTAMRCVSVRHQRRQDDKPVEKLNKNRRSLRVFVIVHRLVVAMSLTELMSKSEPFFSLQQHSVNRSTPMPHQSHQNDAKAFQRAIVRLHQHLCQSRNLRRAIPSVAAMQYDADAVALDVAHNTIDRAQDFAQMRQPKIRLMNNYMA